MRRNNHEESLNSFQLNFVVALLTACGSSDAPAEFLDTTWEWTELVVVDPESRSPIADPPNYTIFFSRDGFVDAEADCNFVQGKYDISGDSVEFKVNAPVLAECGIDSSYCPYLFRLVQAETYKIRDDGKLVLTYGEGAGKLIFNSVGSNISAAGESTGDGDGDSGSAGDSGNKKVTVCINLIRKIPSPLRYPETPCRLTSIMVTTKGLVHKRPIMISWGNSVG